MPLQNEFKMKNSMDDDKHWNIFSLDPRQVPLNENVKLKHEQWGQSPNKPIFYRGTVPNEYIVRPRYAAGREIIVFRDVDVLHSTPDIQYRTSIMRFG